MPGQGGVCNLGGRDSGKVLDVVLDAKMPRVGGQEVADPFGEEFA